MTNERVGYMKKPNLRLKALIIEHYGSQALGAKAFGINEFRLSRIIHNRAQPNAKEKRMIAWKLQRKISDLFPEAAMRQSAF
jgi:hypothetical protein